MKVMMYYFCLDKEFVLTSDAQHSTKTSSNEGTRELQGFLLFLGGTAITYNVGFNTKFGVRKDNSVISYYSKV